MLEIKPIFNSLRRSKAGAMMLLIQIAITVAIVSNAAFIIYDRINYLQQETGYPEQDVFSFSVLTFGTDIDKVQQIQKDEDMLRNVPGVINAVHMSEIPLSGSGSASSFALDADPTDSKTARSAYAFGDENMISTLGVKILEGRDFTQEDVVIQTTPDEIPTVTVVSKGFADDLFPEGDALGSIFHFGPYPIKIIGIIEKMKGPWLKDRAADNMILFPLVTEQTFQKMIVRTEPGQRAAVMRQVEELMLANYDQRVITSPQGMDDAKQEYNASDILMMRMLIVLISVLVMVTALGIFGLTVFNINKRTKQIGTRRALGARKSAIVRYFLVENSLICVFGLALGSIAAIYLGQALLTHYSLPALDNTYVVVTAVCVLCVSLLSVLVPANRAANISPSVATRSV
ncbi:ABC transporter permease [Glaciecola sp. SC05]|uniref:ABC transporter permease n=1 Tax=Glaciecola sp. SC05 TaxID=1987355 RepID=UPI0035292E09